MACGELRFVDWLANAPYPSQSAPLAQPFNFHKAKAVPVAAQFNGIVSGGPKRPWCEAVACAGPPDTTFFILFTASGD